MKGLYAEENIRNHFSLNREEIELVKEMVVKIDQKGIAFNDPIISNEIIS